MKKVLSLFVICCSMNVLAHEEGGPKISDGGKYGGVLAAVIEEGKAKTIILKSELIKNEDNTIKIYLFDTNSKLLAMDTLPAKINAFLEYKVNGKFIKEAFDLLKEGAYFTGKIPKVKRKPFNIDIEFNLNGKKLWAGFENLD
jgi:hypothetical protein